MRAITNKDDLLTAIELIEEKRSNEVDAVKNSVNQLLPTFKVANSLGEIVNKQILTLPFGNLLVKPVVGIIAGIIINKIFSRKSGSQIAKISKLGIEMWLGNLVARYSNTISSFGIRLFKAITRRKH